MAKDTSLTFSLYGKDVSATGAMKKVGKESDSLGKQFAKMGKVAAAGLAVVRGRQRARLCALHARVHGGPPDAHLCRQPLRAF